MFVLMYLSLYLYKKNGERDRLFFTNCFSLRGTVIQHNISQSVYVLMLAINPIKRHFMFYLS